MMKEIVSVKWLKTSIENYTINKIFSQKEIFWLFCTSFVQYMLLNQMISFILQE